MIRGRLATPTLSRADDEPRDKSAVAEVIEYARFAAEKCPGFHLIEDNIWAEYQAAGASHDDMSTPEFARQSQGR